MSEKINKGWLYGIGRALSPPLNETEIRIRKKIAQETTNHVVSLPEWEKLITRVGIFGSLVGGRSKRISDIDLAFWTSQKDFFGNDYYHTRDDLRMTIDEYLVLRGVNAVEIHTTLCVEGGLVRIQGQYCDISKPCREIELQMEVLYLKR